MVLSTVFYSVKSPDNSPLSHSVFLVVFPPYWSFRLYISLLKSPSALIFSFVVDWTESTWDCHKLQVSGLSYKWWGFQARDTLQDSTHNNSIDKVEVFLSVPRYDWCAPLSLPSSCMLVNPRPSQQSSKEEYIPWKWGANARYYASIQRPCYQRGRPCQDPAGNRTTRTFPDHCEETQTAMVWSCLPFIRSGQNQAQ